MSQWLFLNCLASSPRHLIGIRVLAMLADIADACRSIGTENEGEYFSYEIRICPAVFNILLTIGASVETVAYAATPDFAPCRLLVQAATGTFVHEILAACSTIEPAHSYHRLVCLYILHNRQFPTRHPTES